MKMKKSNNLSATFNAYLNAYRAAKKGVSWEDATTAKAVIDSKLTTQNLPGWYSGGLSSLYARWRMLKSDATSAALDAKLASCGVSVVAPVAKAPKAAPAAAPVAASSEFPYSNVKLTKAGKIDKRTIAGRAAIAAGIQVRPAPVAGLTPAPVAGLTPAPVVSLPAPVPVAAPATAQISLETLRQQLADLTAAIARLG